MSPSATPTVYSYLDYRRFLTEWFAAKKAANSRYSYRVFARAAGIKSSGLFLEVAKGRRNLTGATTAAFAKGLKLSADERRFFGLLVQLSQAKTQDERNEAWSEISASRRFREARQLEGQGFDYLSHWYYPAIRELAQRPDFDADPEWVAATLRPAITPAKARNAMQALEQIGMLKRDKAGELQPAEASVVTPHEVFGLAVYNYHRGMIERATEALDEVAASERHYGAVTVAVPESLVGRLKDEIGAFQERILDLCDGASDDAGVVYQLNLQLFPLSRSSQEDS